MLEQKMEGKNSMSENLPQKYEENIFRRFFNKIKNFFLGCKKEVEIQTNMVDDLEPRNVSRNKLEDLKIDVKIDNSEFKRKEFMQNLTEHPELLENFSTDRLEKILQYYLEENEKKREMLKKIAT